MDKRIQIGVKLPPEMISRIDAARDAMGVRVTRTAIIEAAIEAWLGSNVPARPAAPEPARRSQRQPTALPPDPKPIKAR